MNDDATVKPFVSVEKASAMVMIEQFKPEQLSYFSLVFLQ